MVRVATNKFCQVNMFAYKVRDVHVHVYHTCMYSHLHVHQVVRVGTNLVPRLFRRGRKRLVHTVHTCVSNGHVYCSGRGQ